MAERKFVIEQFFRDKRSYAGPTVCCRKCGVKEYYPNSGKGSADKFFTRHGWDIGNGPKMDTCPSCQEQKRIAVPKEIPMPDPKVVPIQPAPTKPREMSREDRQRIHAKIGELYLDNGYQPPWTDRRLAEDMRVPMAWVVEIRDLFFGPEGSNPLFDKFESEATAWMEEFRAFRAIKDQVDALDSMGREIESMLKEIRKGTRKGA